MTANKSPSSHYTFTEGRGKTIFIVVSIIFITLLLDTSIIRISDLTLKSTSSWTLGLFAIIAAISLVGQNLILRYYEGEGREKIDNRLELAAKLKIPLNALRIRVHRIKRTLEDCIAECLERATAKRIGH